MAQAYDIAGATGRRPRILGSLSTMLLAYLIINPLRTRESEINSFQDPPEPSLPLWSGPIILTSHSIPHFT